MSKYNEMEKVLRIIRSICPFKFSPYDSNIYVHDSNM